MFEFAVVVPTKNRLGELRQCLAHLRAASEFASIAIEIVVVDNGSTDGTIEVAEAGELGDVKFLVICGGTIGGLRNEGVLRTSAEAVCFIDSDCLVPPHYFKTLKSVLEEAPSVGVAGATYGYIDQAHWIERDWLDLNHPLRDGPTSLLPGGSMAVRRAVFHQVNGFNPGLEVGEDADFCERVARSGAEVREVSRLRLTHLRNTSTLAQFYGRQRWYAGAGANIGARPSLGKADLLSLLHVSLQIIAIGAAVKSAEVPYLLFAIPAMAVVAPAVLVAFRVMKGGKPSLPHSLLLAFLYLQARGVTLVKLAFLRQFSLR